MFNKKTRWVVIWVFLVFSGSHFSGSSAHARTAAETEEAIEAVLSERHPTDTPEWWRSLGAETPRVILKMIEKNPGIYQRLRLTEALAWFSDDARATEFLKQEAERTEDDVIRNAAIKSVGISQGAREVEFVSKYLKHPDPQTRFAAAQTLQGMKDAIASERLAAYLKEEKASWIQDRLQGNFQKPLKPLAIVSSSEDKVHSEFAGTWRGYFLVPKKEAKGLRSFPVLVRLQIKSATELEGEMVLTLNKKETRVFRLAEWRAKAKKCSGQLPGEFAVSFASQVKKSAEKLPLEKGAIEGELLEQAGTWLFRLEVPKVGGLFFLRRDQ